MAMYSIVATEEERTKIHATKGANINAGAVISVFGISLMGTIEKNNGVTRVLVCPSTENPKQSVKLSSICDEAGISKDKQKSIDDVIKYLGFTGGIAETEIKVYQAFYYYSSSTKDQNGDVNQEYAFSLGINNNFEPQLEGNPPFTIKSISFSLWNSTREKIVDSLGAFSVSDILEKFS